MNGTRTYPAMIRYIWSVYLYFSSRRSFRLATTNRCLSSFIEISHMYLYGNGFFQKYTLIVHRQVVQNGQASGQGDIFVDETLLHTGRRRWSELLLAMGGL